MNEIKIDLSKHQFSDGSKIFIEKELKLSNKNFIFARNGSGKSTLSNLVIDQITGRKVMVFNGFNGMLSEGKLGAVILGKENNELQKQIDEIDKQIDAQQLKNSSFIAEKNDIENLYNKENKKIENFYTTSASQIAEEMKLGRKYDKRNFKKNIDEAEELSSDEVQVLKKIQLENAKTDIPRIDISKYIINLKGYLDSTNEIIVSAISKPQDLIGIDNEEKQNFARHGMEIHSTNEVCAFCGGNISEKRWELLLNYFSDEYEKFENRIDEGLKRIRKQIKSFAGLNLPQVSQFYDKYAEDAQYKISCIDKLVHDNEAFLKLLDDELSKKSDSVTTKLNKLKIVIPVSIRESLCELNELIEENNQFTKNLEDEKNSAKERLIKHKIAFRLKEYDYSDKQKRLLNINLELESIKHKIDVNNQEIVTKNQERNVLIAQTKDERKLANQITEKLKKAGNEKIRLVYAEKENRGIYVIENSDGIQRSIEQLSTGEKNIIAFLYFIGKLEEINSNKKIIIFDDPMSSNDDTMQYLIISELQKMYSGRTPKIYNSNTDFLLIMTHNVHFYLNVQPHEAREDHNGKTKYDKNHFYYLQNGKFRLITSEKEDFQTSYDSLWTELQGMYEKGLRNSMLNSMRRIIETYIEFTKINRDTFYRDNEQYLKLFNVNSHSAIDDLSAEAFTETADELKEVFEQIFIDNDIQNHFKDHWPHN